jgi:CBS domain-containing protein
MTTIPQPRLSHVRVHEAMHQGIISVRPETTMRAVAKIMAERRVHAIAISSLASDDGPRGIVSALEVVAAAAIDAERTAGELAATEVLTISSGDRLDHAGQLMAEHELSHLIVTDAASGQPIGVLSTLDIVAVYGG